MSLAKSAFGPRHDQPIVHGEARRPVAPLEYQHGADDRFGLLELKISPEVITSVFFELLESWEGFEHRLRYRSRLGQLLALLPIVLDCL